MAAPGKAILFLPNRFQSRDAVPAGHPGHLTNVQHPLPQPPPYGPDDPYRFPFVIPNPPLAFNPAPPGPHYLMIHPVPQGPDQQYGTSYGILRNIPVEAADLRTSDHSHTDVAAYIQNMALDKRLEVFNECEFLWDNLKDWVHFDGPALPAGRYRSHNYPSRRRLPLPDASSQSQGIAGTWGWFIQMKNRRKPIKAASEPAVQGEVTKQILEGLDGLLQTRYSYVGGYPSWGKAPHAMHVDANNRRAAGFPDNNLQCGPDVGDSVVTSEVKTHWSYKSVDFRKIFQPGPDYVFLHRQIPFAPDSGLNNLFNWNMATKHYLSGAIKQVWAQMLFFQTHFAFWTNGDHIYVFVKTGRQSLTISSAPRFWSDLDIHWGLFGLSCAGMDHHRMNAIEGARFIDYLSPPSTRF